MTGRITLPQPVEQHMPWRGPCGLCGGPDARHRILDAIHDRVRTGETPTEIAADYPLPTDVIDYIATHWDGDTETWKTGEDT